MEAASHRRTPAPSMLLKRDLGASGGVRGEGGANRGPTHGPGISLSLEGGMPKDSPPT